MQNAITFTYKGKQYTLTYTLRSVAMMEQDGFKADKFSDLPMTNILKLFRGAFFAKHSDMKQEEIYEIYDHFTDKKGLLEALTKMYAKTANSIYEDATGDEKNVTWSAAMTEPTTEKTNL